MRAPIYQSKISLALQVKPALYHALSQSGLSREEAIKVVETFSSYVKKEGEVVLIPFKSGQRSEGSCRISLLNQWVTETLSRKLTV